MASVYTSNLALQEPANGDLIGSWDTAVNQNMIAVDLAAGQSQSIGLAAGSVTLSTAQTRSAVLIFTGNLVGNVAVTIPGLSSAPGTTVSGRTYTVNNQTGNSSTFQVTLQTTVAGSQAIGVPPFEPVDIYVEGTGGVNVGSIKFRNLGRIGQYWDYGGSSVPWWVSVCTVPPYLNCDGSAFSSAAYPALTHALGGTTLPDSRGRTRFALNQGQSRVTSAVSGVNGDAILSAGGDEHMNFHNHGITDPGHIHATANGFSILTSGPSGGSGAGASGLASTIASAVTGITVNTNGAGLSENIPPAYIGGLTMIRAG